MIIVENILKELDMAFGLISSIPVSGEAVDTMAVARQKLRGVYAELKKLSENAKKEAETDG